MVEYYIVNKIIEYIAVMIITKDLFVIMGKPNYMDKLNLKIVTK